MAPGDNLVEATPPAGLPAVEEASVKNENTTAKEELEHALFEVRCPAASGCNDSS